MVIASQSPHRLIDGSDGDRLATVPWEGAFGVGDFLPAQDLAVIAGGLIDRHSRFGLLASAHIDFLKYVLLAHDWEGFQAEIAEYGAWHSTLGRIARQFEQLRLPDGEALVEEIARQADGQTLSVREGLTATITAGRKRPASSALPQFVQAIATAEPPVICYEDHAPIPEGTAYYREDATGQVYCETCYERLPHAMSTPAPEPVGAEA